MPTSGSISNPGTKVDSLDRVVRTKFRGGLLGTASERVYRAKVLFFKIKLDSTSNLITPQAFLKRVILKSKE